MMPVADLEEALERVHDQKDALQRVGVRSLEIFGSLARGDSRPDSDVDVLVSFEGPATFSAFMDVKFLLEEALGRRVDLVTRPALRKEMATAIQKEAVRAA